MDNNNIEHCYECKEPFELTKEHEFTYRSSGLCPKCYRVAMEYFHKDPTSDDFMSVLMKIEERITEILLFLKQRR